MNKKRAFTLIELMIVIAVLGISFTMLGPIESILRSDDSHTRVIDEEYALTRAYMAIKYILKNGKSITSFTETNLFLDNDIKLGIERNGKRLIAGEKTIDLPGRARIFELQVIDSTSFSTMICNGKELIKVFWKVGEENEK